jgi:hypothetical protein
MSQLFKKINYTLVLTAVLFFFSACGGGGGSAGSGNTGTSEPSAGTTTSSVPAGKAVHKGQVKDAATGDPLAGVKVSIGEVSAMSDADGLYTLTNLDEAEEVVVNFEKEGYLPGSTLIQIKILSGDNTPSSNYLEYVLDAYDYQPSYDSRTEAVGKNIDIPAAVYTDESGAPYEGIVTTGVEILDPASEEGKELFPGSFEGEDSNGETVKFDAYSMIDVSPKDAEGNKLKFKDNVTATLTFDIAVSLNEQIIPMWYYDYDQGKWIEEGYAERQEDGTYQGEISHPGTWSLSKPIESTPGIYRGRIIYEDGTPAKDVRVHAIGNKWVACDLSTDKEGIFEIEVIPDSSFQLKAYNYKDKYEAEYDGIIPAIASGEVVEDGM